MEITEPQQHTDATSRKDVLSVKTKKILRFCENRVKQDREAVFFVFLTALSKDTDDPRNIFMKGKSGIGKTWVTTNTLKPFNKKDLWYLGGLSPTALYHDYGELVDEADEPIDILDKPNKEQIKIDLQFEHPEKEISKAVVWKEYREQMKKWREKIKTSYYRVDMHGKLLIFLDAPHPETFARLLPILSHDKEEISYRTTTKTGRGQLRTEHVKVCGWPACIFCTTDRKWLEDFSTRSFTITPRTTDVKIRNSLRLSGRDNGFPKRFREDEAESVRIGVFLEGLKEKMGKFEVLLPFSVGMAEIVPIYRERVMRDFKHLLTFIRLNALLNCENRPKITGDETTFLLATQKDFIDVLKMFQFCEETTITGLNQHVITVFNEAMIPLQVFSYKSLVEKVHEVLDYPLSSKTLYKYVAELANIGWVDEEPDPEDKRKKIITVIRKEKNLLSYSLDKFRQFFTLETFKAWLKEFIILFSQNSKTNIPNFELEGIPYIKWDNDVHEVFEKYYTEKNIFENQKRENN